MQGIETLIVVSIVMFMVLGAISVLAHIYIIGKRSSNMYEIYRVALFGHRTLYDLRKVEDRLAPILENLLRTKEYVEFYIGRHGEFDEYAASVIKRVQKAVRDDNSVMILTLPYTVKDIEFYEE